MVAGLMILVLGKQSTVKPPIIPGDREQHKAGNERRTGRGEGS